MTMGSSGSRESSQHASAAESVVSSAPVVDLTVPEPVNPTISSATAAGEARHGATIDLSSPTDKGKKRKVDDSVSADEEDSLPSSSSPRAAKRAKVEESEQAQPVLESIFGGPPGPPCDSPPCAPGPSAGFSSAGGHQSTTDDDDEVVFVSSRPKRARQDDPEEDSDDDVVFVRSGKRVRSTSPSAVDACSIDATRGLKRRVDDDDVIEVSANPVKRLRADDTTSFVETADEEVVRADLPLSAADVVRAATPNNVVDSGSVDAGAAQEGAPTEGKTSFLSLPLELREMIYHLVLVAPKAVVPRVPQRSQAYRVGFPIGRVTSLLLANKQIHQEALHLLFRENVFKLSIKHHRAWLNTIGRSFSGDLRRLIIECDGKNKHAAENLVAFQNTLKKRTSGDQLRELTYQFLWSMTGQAAFSMFHRPEFRYAWKKTWKRLESVTVDSLDRQGTGSVNNLTVGYNAQRLATEERHRTLSRIVLDSGVPVYGRMLRLWRRDKKSLPWCKVTLKDGWEKHCTRDRRDGKWMPQSWDKWAEIVNIEVIPPDFS